MQSTRKQKVVYVPLPEEIVEKYAYKVCAKLVACDHPSGPDTEIVRGFTSFFKVVAGIQLKYLNKGVSDAQKET